MREGIKVYGPILTRIGIGIVFLWFGINQLINPEDFLSYLPEFLFAMDSAKMILLVNGIFEIVLSTFLLIGLFVRPVSLLLSIHLLAIVISLGYNDIAVRDFGLMIVTFATFLGGADKWSLDYRRNKRL